MIEALLEDVCIDCGKCVEVCPDDVFDSGSGHPEIARQTDCQSCYLCEVYCPVDALYVAPVAFPQPDFDVVTVRAAGLFGGYRRAVNWKEGRPGEPDRTRFIPKIIAYKGDQSDYIRVGLAGTRNKSFVDPNAD